MNNTQPSRSNPVYQEIRDQTLRNPLFNPLVVSRALLTLRETITQLTEIIESSDKSLLGTKGSEFIRLNADLKINEITDELTINRLTG